MEDLTFEVMTRWSGTGHDAVGTVQTGGQVLAWSVPSGMGGRGEGSRRSPDSRHGSPACSPPPASWAAIPVGWGSISAPPSWPETTVSSAVICVLT